MNILFVCGRNKKRSRTAERIFRNEQAFSSKSAGFSKSSPVRLSDCLISWADLILVMEFEHSKRIGEIFANVELPPIEVLNILDEFDFMNVELISFLKEGTEWIIKKYKLL